MNPILIRDISMDQSCIVFVVNLEGLEKEESSAGQTVDLALSAGLLFSDC